MAQLTIRFKNLGVFVNGRHGLTVLLPRRDHLAGIITANGPQRLDGDLIQLLKDGAPLHRETTRDNGDYLVNMNDILPVGWSLQTSSKLQRLILARFELGGGALTAPMSAAQPPYDDVSWHIGDFFMHKLTDQAIFQLELDPDSSYDLLFSRGQYAQVLHVPKEGTNIDVIVGEDHAPPAFDGTLLEFKYLYDVFLLPKGSEPKTLPVPVGPKPIDPQRVQRAQNLSILCDYPICPLCQA